MDWNSNVATRRCAARPSASWMNLYGILGYMGKGKIPLIGLFSYGLVIGLTLMAFGCSGEEAASVLQSGRVVGLGRVDGRWVGPVSPVSAGCGNQTIGTMTVGQGSFGFAPFGNTVSIKGRVGPDDAMDGVLERLGGDRKPVSIRMHAEASEEGSIVGKLDSGKCQWAFKLARG